MNKAIDVAQNHQLYLCLALRTPSAACQKFMNEWRHGGSFLHALISKLQRIGVRQPTVHTPRTPSDQGASTTHTQFQRQLARASPPLPWKQPPHPSIKCRHTNSLWTTNSIA